MKLCILISMFLILPASVMAQGLAKVVEPLRVSLSDDSTATATDKAFNELLRLELNERATVRFTQAKFDYRVLTATAEITSKGKLTGYSAAVAVLTQAEGKEVSLRLHVMVGPTLDAVASDAGAFLEKELQTKRRKK